MTVNPGIPFIVTFDCAVIVTNKSGVFVFSVVVGKLSVSVYVPFDAMVLRIDVPSASDSLIAAVGAFDQVWPELGEDVSSSCAFVLP